jgi:Tfp pilus assembly protein FimT
MRGIINNKFGSKKDSQQSVAKCGASDVKQRAPVGRRLSEVRCLAGFSLLEVVVTIGVMMILSGIMLGYNRTSGRQLALYSSQAKVVGFLNRAKAAALEKKDLANKKVCAFGVRFRDQSKPNSMILFADLPSSPNSGCDSNNKIYGGQDEYVSELALDEGIEIRDFTPSSGSGGDAGGSNNQNNIDIVFEPPYLVTHNPGVITLAVQGQNIFLCVEVNQGGAVFARNCP